MTITEKAGTATLPSLQRMIKLATKSRIIADYRERQKIKAHAKCKPSLRLNLLHQMIIGQHEWVRFLENFIIFALLMYDWFFQISLCLSAIILILLDFFSQIAWFTRGNLCFWRKVDVSWLPLSVHCRHEAQFLLIGGVRGKPRDLKNKTHQKKKHKE